MVFHSLFLQPRQFAFYAPPLLQGQAHAFPVKQYLAAGLIPWQHGAMQCWIMHVDMDAFYASIEQMDHPELRGKPVIVGGSLKRGVVSAASYEARKFGVRSAMPLRLALRKCPEALFLPVRMSRYKEISQHVMEVLHHYSPSVEQASVDEAYLDATGLEKIFGPVETMAHRLKQDVKKATGGLTCSVGLAPIKFLAKIASELHKPDGLSILPPERVPLFLAHLPVERFPGVGKQFASSLHSLGIRTGKEVLQYPSEFWERRFGKPGLSLYERAQGLDHRKVETNLSPKSESAETTFIEDTLDKNSLKHHLYQQSDRVGRSLRKQKLKGRIVTLKIKYIDFRLLTRRTTLELSTCSTRTIYDTACKLLETLILEKPVRLIGVGLSGFETASQQLFLPLNHTPEIEDERRTRLENTLDALRERFGENAIVPGYLFTPMTPKGDK